MRSQRVCDAQASWQRRACTGELCQAAQGGTAVAGARWVGSQPSAHSRNPKDKVMCGDGGWQRKQTSPSNPTIAQILKNLHKSKVQSSLGESPVHWERSQEPAVEDKAQRSGKNHEWLKLLLLRTILCWVTLRSLLSVCPNHE